MQIKIKYSPEFIQTVSKAKQKKAQKNNLLREIYYKRSHIRFYGSSKNCQGADPILMGNIVIRTLDEIKELKAKLKTF